MESTAFDFLEIAVAISLAILFMQEHRRKLPGTGPKTFMFWSFFANDCSSLQTTEVHCELHKVTVVREIVVVLSPEEADY